MRSAFRWLMVLTIATIAAITLGPEASTSYARGGRGGGGRGGGGRGGGGRGGGGRGGGGRGGRGGGRGGGGGRGRGGPGGGGSARGGNVKDPFDYLVKIQRQDADDGRLDFIFGQRDEQLLTDRDKEREKAMSAERERSSRQLRDEQQASTNPL